MEQIESRLRTLADAARESERCAEDDRQARDAAIEDGELAGLSIRRIAKMTGLSTTQVQRIVVNRTAMRQAT